MRISVARWNDEKAYFFCGNQYIRYLIGPDRADDGYPRKIKGNWAGLDKFSDGIDAVAVWPNGKAFFFKGDQYIRFDVKKDKADSGYPAPIKGNWKGLDIKGNWAGSDKFSDGIDAVTVWANDKAYFFNGDQYIRFDVTKDKADSGFPLLIDGNWAGLFGGSFGTPDVVIQYRQRVNFYVFDQDPTATPHHTTSPGEGMFIAYTIDSIKVADDGAFLPSPFPFELKRLGATTKAQVSGTSSLDEYFKSAPDAVTVTDGSEANGTFLTVVEGDPNALKDAVIPLHYWGPSGLSVQCIRRGGKPSFAAPMTPDKAVSYK